MFPEIPEKSYNLSDYFLVALFAFSSFLAITSNTFILWVIYSKRMCSTTYVLISCQAVSDLLCGLQTPLAWTFCSYSLIKDYDTEVPCDVIRTFQMTSFFVSVYSMMAIAIDRYSKLYLVDKRINCRLAIASIWLIGFAISVLQLINSKSAVFFLPNRFEGCRVSLRSDLKFFSEEYGLLRFIMTTVFANVVPLIVTAVLYGKVIAKVNERKVVGNQINSERRNTLEMRKRKTVIMLIIIFVSYSVMTVPLYIIVIISKVIPGMLPQPCLEDMPPSTIPIKTSLFMLSLTTSTNFFILVWFNDEFNSALKNAFKCQPTQQCPSNMSSERDVETAHHT